MMNNHAPNGDKMQFKHHPRHGLMAIIPSINTKAQLSVQSDYDRSFGVRPAQLCNTLPADINTLKSLDSFKIGQVPGAVPGHVPRYTPADDHSLLSWRRMCVMQMFWYTPIQTYHNYVCMFSDNGQHLDN